jgi:hypothetical protein
MKCAYRDVGLSAGTTSLARVDAVLAIWAAVLDLPDRANPPGRHHCEIRPATARPRRTVH